MRIAIFGATSQIAKDLVLSFSTQGDVDLALFARRPDAVVQWLADVGMAGRHVVADFAAFSPDQRFDAVLNFVGVGNPAQAAAMGASIFEVTQYYDELVLDYLQIYPDCRYLFLSSGAVFGAGFDNPVNEHSVATVPINNLQPQNWYGISKLYAECRHRSRADLRIVDLRIFNYFSATQDLSARFLVTDILRAIRDEAVLNTSADFIVRDFLHPGDFYRMVIAILAASPINDALDCYTRSPIDKPTLLSEMGSRFGLKYRISDPSLAVVNATGVKSHYYSDNRRAEQYGYFPAMSSLDGLITEFQKVLG